MADLQHIRQMGCDMKGMALISPRHLVFEDLNIHCLRHPGRTVFQIVQENLRYDILIIELFLILFRADTQIILNPALQIFIHVGITGLCRLHKCKNPVFQLCIISAAAAHMLQRSPCRDSDLCISALGAENNGLCHSFSFFLQHGIQGQNLNTVHQNELLFLALFLRSAVPEHQRFQEHPQISGFCILGQRHDDILQLIPDALLLQVHEPVIRADGLLQIMGPEIFHLLLGDILHALGPAFPVPGVELGDHLSQELGALDSDLSVPVHEQLIQKLQRLLLLDIIGIGKILPEDIQVSADIFPVLLTSRSLQEVAEASVRHHAVHHREVVLDSHEGQGLHRLLRRLQSRQRHLGRLFRVSGQVDVDAIGPHPGLKVLQLGIDKPVPHDLLLIDIEEFPEDRVEGVG